MFAKHVVAVSLGLFCVTVFSPTSFGQTAPEQDDEPSARGAFFATRPGGRNANRTTTKRKSTTTTTGGAHPTTNRENSHHRPKTKADDDAVKGGESQKTTSTARKNGGALTKGGGPTNSPGTANSASSVSITAGAGEAPADSIGLGYTLYMRAADGDAVRVDPGKEFGAGDQIRVALEANTDGYLYIFHTEDGRNPQMLFPDARLGGGANAIRAHVPHQVPSALTDWFKFDDKPAVEQLYIVVARTPLPDVPTGGALVKNCENNSTACAWRPAPRTWAQIKSHASAPAAVSKSTEFGQKESQIERDSLTRGIGLALDAPAPSVVRINTSSNKNILVTTVELVHK